MTGYVLIHRKIQDNPLWQAEKFSRGQAWVDLILLANHTEGFIYVRGVKVKLKRGQIGWSQNRLSKRWDWSRSKVRKFLDDLEEEQQIKQHNNTVTTVITVTNYEKYQPNVPAKHQQKNNKTTSKKQQKDTNKNVNNENNDKKYTCHSYLQWDGNQPADYKSFVDKFNAMYGRQLRVTEKKRKQIRGRLRTFSGEEIVKAWKNRLNDDWLTGEGSKYLADWNAAMRNDEKVDKYLNNRNDASLLDNNKMRMGEDED